MAVCMCIYTYIYTHTYIHVYTHTYIHTHTHIPLDMYDHPKLIIAITSYTFPSQFPHHVPTYLCAHVTITNTYARHKDMQSFPTPYVQRDV